MNKGQGRTKQKSLGGDLKESWEGGKKGKGVGEREKEGKEEPDGKKQEGKGDLRYWKELSVSVYQHL